MCKYNGIDPKYIPKLGTQARALLDMLWCNPELSIKQIENKFGINARSPLQLLMGQKYHWLIHPIFDPDTGKIIARKLDDRHLTGDPKYDFKARLERRIKLTSDSRKQASRERKREPVAIRKEQVAKNELAEFHGLIAANEPLFKKKAE